MMLTGQATACANIALIKYWGKRDTTLNLPANDSLSISLSALTTSTCVTLVPKNKTNLVFILNEQPAPAALTKRLSQWFELLQQAFAFSYSIQVVSANNFPYGAGLASSASGFAALVLAVNQALGLDWSLAELATWARRGSGSAARSLLTGFVQFNAGTKADGSDTTVERLAPPSYWQLHSVICITADTPKMIGSTVGMEQSRLQAPFYQAWLQAAAVDIQKCRAAIWARDFEQLALLSEHSCMKMHGLMLSNQPYLLYWNPATVAVITKISRLRQEGLPVFFTIDAGPQVKAICLPAATAKVAKLLAKIPGVLRVMTSAMGDDTLCC